MIPRQPKKEEILKYIDKVITLVNGSILIGRVLVDEEYLNEHSITVFRPMEVIDDSVDVYLRKWIGPSKDDVYYIPLEKILNVSNPNNMFLSSFENILNKDYSEYQSNDENSEEMEDAFDEEEVYDEIVKH